MLFPQEKTTVEKPTLESTCLACHRQQQIPSDLIYKRYLMHYSTPTRIEKAMFHYLQTPSREHSIMPAQFFLKFPMMKAIDMDEKELKKYIRLYMETFDVKKKLVLEK